MFTRLLQSCQASCFGTIPEALNFFEVVGQELTPILSRLFL